jgi:hypothetical protein
MTSILHWLVDNIGEIIIGLGLYAAYNAVRGPK